MLGARRAMRMASGKLIVGVDLGGTNINVGLVDPAGKLLPASRVNKKTQAVLGTATVIQRIADAIGESCAAAGVAVRSVSGIGIGAAGAVDSARGVVLKGGNLGFVNVPLASAIQKKLGPRVVLENDVNAAAYGEWKLGAAAGKRDFLAVWIGTGVGGGLVLDGKLYSGGMFTAGEIGHMLLFPGAPLGRRTLEENCSRTAVSDRLLALMASGHASSLRATVDAEKKALTVKAQDEMEKKGRISWQFENNKILRSKAIGEAYRRGDALTVRVIEEAAELLGAAIGGVVTLLSLPHVVLGGGLTEALDDAWVKAVRKSVRDHAFPAECKKVEVLGTLLKDQSGILGAAMLARDGAGSCRAARAGRPGRT
jgi:glucokinase